MSRAAVTMLFPMTLAILGAFVQAPAQAAIVVTQEALLLEGDPVPGSPGSTFDGALSPGLGPSLTVAFLAQFQLPAGQGISYGLFAKPAGSPLREIALAGSAAPCTSQGFEFGIFLDDGGVLSCVALTGDVAPDTGGTFLEFYRPSLNEDGAVAFRSRVKLPGPGAARPGIFVKEGGTTTLVAFEGDSVPGVPGGVFTDFGNPEFSREAATDLVFRARFEVGGAVRTGYFLHSNETYEPVVLEGDPKPGGGSFEAFYNDAVDLISPPPSTLALFSAGTGVYRYSWTSGLPAETSVYAETGDPAPGTAGGTFGSFSAFGPPTYEPTNGGAIFMAGVQGGASNRGIFLAGLGSETAPLVLRHDPAPDTGGGNHDVFLSAPSPAHAEDGLTHVAFSSSILGGSASFGLFLLPEPDAGVGISVGVAWLWVLSRTRRGW